MNLVTVTSHQSTLILWDIDHTLVTIGEVSPRIYEVAFSEAFGGPLRELTDSNVVQTVVTGNIKPIAVTKLEAFHLSQYLNLDIGGYGSDGDTRPPLIRRAWKRAQRKYDWTFGADRVVVIGDTPFDVSAAHEVGVHAVGVATGSLYRTRARHLNSTQATVDRAHLPLT